MNRAEQKERLTDIIDAIQNSIVTIKDHISLYEEIVQDYTEIYEKVSEQFAVSNPLELDQDDFAIALTKAILDEHADLENISSELEDFQSDLEDYKEEISESRAEKIEERYADLEEVYDSIYGLTDIDEITLDEVIEELEEKIQWLKGMKK